ncbi:MAG: Rho termination factor N-terminal domain-containing protein, partial [Firmicutes bacterium]|nr:Rho termination factor N-terminal domain-containing protein [Bacillota bacterium]
MDKDTLKAKKVADLREIAKALGVSAPTSLRKAELIDAIVSVSETAESEKAPVRKPEESETKIARRKTAKKKDEGASEEKKRTVKKSTVKTSKGAKTSKVSGLAAKIARAEKAAEKAAGKDAENAAEDDTVQINEFDGRKAESEEAASKAPRRAAKVEAADNEAENAEAADQADEEEKADKKGKPRQMHIDSDNKYEVDGILEIAEGGFGFLRFDNFLTSDDDVYVAPQQIRRFNLKTGDRING